MEVLSTDFLPLCFAYGGVQAMLGEQEESCGWCSTLNWSPSSLDGRSYLRSCWAPYAASPPSACRHGLSCPLSLRASEFCTASHQVLEAGLIPL